MKPALCSTSLLVVLVLSSTCYGLRIYLSDSSTSPTMSNPTLELQPDGTSSLFVWVVPDADETINGMGLSLRAIDPNVVAVTSHQVLNPVNDILGTPRWNAVSAGATNVGHFLVKDSNAASIFDANGLDPDRFTVEWDPLAVIEGELAAYLHSQVDVVALGIGQTELFLQVGEALITIEGHGAADIVQFGAGDVPGVSGGMVGATDSEPDGYINVFEGFTELTWDGLGDGNWNDPNWIGGEPGSVPDATTGVSVEANTVTVTSDAYARSLDVDSGGAVAVNAGSALAITDNVDVGNGTLGIASTAALTVGGIVTFAEGSVYACKLGEAGVGLITSTGDVSLSTGSTLVMQATGSLGAVGDAAKTIILADEGATIDGTFTNAPASDEHLGQGVFLQSIDYTETATDVHVFQAAEGDTDGNRQINNADLQSILGANSFNNGTGFDWTQGDFDGDTDVDNSDLQLILATGYFGTGPYAAVTPDAFDGGLIVVPEPGTLALLACGLIGLLWWRRRRAT